MFTGIVNTTGTVTAAKAEAGDLRLTVACPLADIDLLPGASVACAGACLTVAEAGSGVFSATLSAETLSCTAPHHWRQGARINIEAALRVGDALGGHLVTGHVDGLAKLLEIKPSKDSHVLVLEAPEALKRFIAAKGSVTLDGVSLTVNTVENTRFTVNIIPHTWQVTTLGERKAGDLLNMEVDMIARYLDRLRAS